MKTHQLSTFRWSPSQPTFWPQVEACSATFWSENLFCPSPDAPTPSQLGAMLQKHVVQLPNRPLHGLKKTLIVRGHSDFLGALGFVHELFAYMVGRTWRALPGGLLSLSLGLSIRRGLWGQGLPSWGDLCAGGWVIRAALPKLL